MGFVQQSGNGADYHRGAFLNGGGFDEELPFIEDTELSLKMKHHDGAVYDPKCWVETSVRRQRRGGNAGLFWTYLTEKLFIL